jgi:hypothetical protein
VAEEPLEQGGGPVVLAGEGEVVDQPEAGVYPPQAQAFPIGQAMNKNLTVKIGNRRDHRATRGLAARCRPGMLCGMQEIARFLASHPPFDGLPPELLEQTAATVEIAYFPGGATILRQGGDRRRMIVC